MIRQSSFPRYVIKSSVLLCLIVLPFAMSYGSATTSGTFKTFTNIHSLGFEWLLSGDTDHDAKCQVQFREKGTTTYHQGLPLFRIHYKNSKGTTYNMFSGSIMFLKPGTTYQVNIQLSDPDGGSTSKSLELTTRAIPALPTGGKIYHVIPGSGGGTGTSSNPFKGPAAALKVAVAGDTLLLHKGTYAPFRISNSGKADKYLVLKAAGDGEATMRQVTIDGSYLWLEGLVFRVGSDTTALRSVNNGRSHCVIKGNKFFGFHYSISLSGGDSGSQNWYIADNEIVGDMYDPSASNFSSGEGIEMQFTSGHTICHNRISRVADGMSYARRNVDIFGNDIFLTTDDGIELDGSMGNIRVWGNRLFRCYQHNFSFQDMDCPPVYFVRNQVVTDSPASGVFKFRQQEQFLFANNTVIMRGRNQYHAQAFLRSYMRNNLWILPSGTNKTMWDASSPSSSTIEGGNHSSDSVNRKKDWRTNVDNDGFDWNTTKYFMFWYGKGYNSFTSLASEIGIYKNGKRVYRDQLFGSSLTYSQSMHLTLKSGCSAIDAGVVVPNIVASFNGPAPDLGACEYGAPLPVYGPRPASSSVTTSKPAAPSSLTAASASSSQINLNWIDNSSVESGYKIERSTDGTTFGQIGTVGANITSYASTGLAASSKYYYRVRAYNESGDSGYSNIASATTSAAVTTPSAPTGATATASSSSQINLAWTDSSSNEDGFWVRRSLDGTSFSVVATLPANASSHSDAGLSESTKYYYRITAFNSAGSSSSPTISATTLTASKPAAPSSLAATVVSTSQIDLNWTDNSSVESGFNIERSPDGITFSQVGTVGANVTKYSNTGLNDGTKYHYRVRAYNSNGNSSYSNIASATTQTALTAPSAPSGVTVAAVSSSQMNLTWTDTSSNEEGFWVRRSLDGTSFSVVATLPANASSHSDAALTASTKYYYRITAFNDAGYQSSATASGSTLSPAIPPTAPVLEATVSSETSVLTKWTASTDNDGIAGYRIYRDGVEISRSTDLEHLDQNLTPGNNYSYNVKAEDKTGLLSESSNVLSVSLPQLQKVVLLVAGSTSLNSGDSAIQQRLVNSGFHVEVLSASAVQSGDASGKSLILISSTVASDSLGSRLRDVAVPVICWEPYLFDDMAMTGTLVGVDFDWLNDQTRVHVNGTSSSIALGVEGWQSVHSTAEPMSWGKPGTGAHIVATITGSSDTPCIFTYRAGGKMVGISAPAARVGFFLGNTGANNFTASGWKLFDQTIAWALAN
jgi:fibronectin type 3 domain-containing protein